MFYDLNVPWSANDPQLPRTLAFLHELGYNVVALNHCIEGKLPADLTNPINPLPPHPPALTLLTRCTLTLTSTHQNARLASLSQTYDLLALRPIDDKTLTLACTTLDCDIITLDLSARLPFWLNTKHRLLSAAIKAGKKLEICYAQGINASGGGDARARREVVGNATQLIRATRGRGLVLASEARRAVECRGPWDVVNLATVWGLSQERGFEAVSKECRALVVAARLKRTSFRGVVDVVYGGEKAESAKHGGKEGETAVLGGSSGKLKRKAEVADEGLGDEVDVKEKPLSKRAMKRLRKEKLMAAENADHDSSAGADNSIDHKVESKNHENGVA